MSSKAPHNAPNVPVFPSQVCDDCAWELAYLGCIHCGLPIVNSCLTRVLDGLLWCKMNMDFSDCTSSCVGDRVHKREYAVNVVVLVPWLFNEYRMKATRRLVMVFRKFWIYRDLSEGDKPGIFYLRLTPDLDLLLSIPSAAGSRHNPISTRDREVEGVRELTAGFHTLLAQPGR